MKETIFKCKHESVVNKICLDCGEDFEETYFKLVYVTDEKNERGYKSVIIAEAIEKNLSIIKCNFPDCNEPATSLDKHYPYENTYTSCKKHSKEIYLIHSDALKDKINVPYSEWLMFNNISQDKFISKYLKKIEFVKDKMNRFLARKDKVNHFKMVVEIHKLTHSLRDYCEVFNLNYLIVYQEINKIVNMDELNVILMSEIK